jgi:CMP-N-acetylneuraminic acid synthetase
VDIFAAQELLLRFEKEEVCVISMNETELRLRNLFLIDKFGLASRISSGIEKNRQDDVSIYSMNGAIFAAKSLYLRSINYNFVAGNVIPLVMPKNRSIDVDDLNDFENAISLIEKKIR